MMMMMMRNYIWFQVFGIMRQNMDKVIDRDNKLSDLDNRAGKLYLVKFVIFTLTYF